MRAGAGENGGVGGGGRGTGGRPRSLGRQQTEDVMGSHGGACSMPALPPDTISAKLQQHAICTVERDGAMRFRASARVINDALARR